MKTVVIPKQGAGINYTGAWTGLSGGNEVQLENISDENHAKGNFGLGGKELADSSGAGANPLVEGTDYHYDERLDDSSGGGVDIYDDATSGALTDKFRVVNDSKNITDVTGLNLKVRAKNLSNIISPPADECYIDPAKGKLVLPRPTFWSKCESWDNWNNPEIAEEGTPYYSTDTTISTIAGKFGQMLRSFGSVTPGNTKYVNLYTDQSNGNTGTISFWTYGTDPAGLAFLTMACYFDNNSYFSFNNGGLSDSRSIFIDGVNDIWGAWSPVTSLSHFYIVWDNSGGMSSGKTIRVFRNGVENISTTSSWTLGTSQMLLQAIYTVSGLGSTTGFNSYFDNVKVWDHVVSEDPSFEYNGGTGREEALHTIYGAGNGYKPNGLDVGYFYIPDSDAPAGISEANAVGASAEWVI